MENGRTFENGYKATEQYPEYIDHYFYFPTSSAAESAADQLRTKGWQTQVRLGADEINWLALATQPARGDEDMGQLWHELTEFASQFGGEYDGWERPADDGGFVN